MTNLRDFERFRRAAALRSGQLLNRADLARDAGISGSTAGAWLSALEASHQVMLLEPWFANRTKSLVKRPKLYVRDPGLRAFLCGVQTTEALRSSPLAGPLWETFVCAEIRRTQSKRRGGWDFHFWGDRTREADFPAAPGGDVPPRRREVDRAPERPRRRPAPGDRPRVAGRRGPVAVDLLPDPEPLPAPTTPETHAPCLSMLRRHWADLDIRTLTEITLPCATRANAQTTGCAWV